MLVDCWAVASHCLLKDNWAKTVEASAGMKSVVEKRGKQKLLSASRRCSGALPHSYCPRASGRVTPGPFRNHGAERQALVFSQVPMGEPRVHNWPQPLKREGGLNSVSGGWTAPCIPSLLPLPLPSKQGRCGPCALAASAR